MAIPHALLKHTSGQLHGKFRECEPTLPKGLDQGRETDRVQLECEPLGCELT